MFWIDLIGKEHILYYSLYIALIINPCSAVLTASLYSATLCRPKSMSVWRRSMQTFNHVICAVGTLWSLCRTCIVPKHCAFKFDWYWEADN